MGQGGNIRTQHGMNNDTRLYVWTNVQMSDNKRPAASGDGESELMDAMTKMEIGRADNKETTDELMRLAQSLPRQQRAAIYYRALRSEMARSIFEGIIDTYLRHKRKVFEAVVYASNLDDVDCPEVDAFKVAACALPEMIGAKVSGLRAFEVEGGRVLFRLSFE